MHTTIADIDAIRAAIDDGDHDSVHYLADALDDVGQCALARNLRRVVAEWAPCIPCDDGRVMTRHGSTLMPSDDDTISSAYLRLADALK